MNNSGDIPAAAAPADQQVLLEYLQLSEAISETAPEDLARQIPSLVQDTASHSTDSDRIVRFEVGMSFTGTSSLFDYSLTRVHPSESGIRSEGPSRSVCAETIITSGSAVPGIRISIIGCSRGILLPALIHRILEPRESSPADGETVFSDIYGLLGDLHEGNSP